MKEVGKSGSPKFRGKEITKMSLKKKVLQAHRKVISVTACRSKRSFDVRKPLLEKIYLI